MSIKFEPIILTIIPKITTEIPTRLIETAQSLHALSKQKVPSLRPDEEAARAHVCARIACERLKTQLDLPKINTDKPPLRKTQYNTLLKQFQLALPERQIQSRNTQASSVPPSKYHHTITRDVESSIQNLCRDTGVPAASDCIIQGLSYVLEKELPQLSTSDRFDIPTAIVAIRRLYLLRQIEGTSSMTQTQAKEKTVEYIKALGEFGNPIKITRVLKLSTEWSVACQGWKWWTDIPAGGYGVKATPTAAPQKRKRTAFESGIGSMLRNEFDFLSEKRRKAYGQWKGDVVKRIEQLEALEASA